jgi:CrcB protein
MTSPAVQALAVAAGAAAGALARWGTGLWLNPAWAGFPLGTLAVNCIGGLAVGVAWALLAPGGTWWLLLVPGFLGGLTTFSAFSGESLLLLQRGQFSLALLHSGAHVLGALACAAAGYYAAARAWA